MNEHNTPSITSHMDDRSESSRGTWLITFGLLALILLVGLIPLRRNYTSVARIDLGPPTNPSGTNAHVTFDPSFLQTEFERIKSSAVLSQVLAELRSLPGFEKHTRISPDSSLPDALRRLQKIIDLRQSRSTTLIEIRARTSHPQISADLANKLAEVYIRAAATNGFRATLVDRAVSARQ
jgi:uncharacterized protein involved in exopolysaccharide biosynthesis